jgi:hypothetical protein
MSVGGILELQQVGSLLIALPCCTCRTGWPVRSYGLGSAGAAGVFACGDSTHGSLAKVTIQSWPLTCMRKAWDYGNACSCRESWREIFYRGRGR